MIGGAEPVSEFNDIKTENFISDTKGDTTLRGDFFFDFVGSQTEFEKGESLGTRGRWDERTGGKIH